MVRYTYQCALKYTHTRLQTLRDKDLILLMENIFRGGISSVLDDRHIKSHENKKVRNKDATNLFGHSMSQMLPYDEIVMWVGHPDLFMNKLEKLSNTPDDAEIGYFFEVDSIYSDEIKEKTNNFPFAPENKTCNRNDFFYYVKKNHKMTHKIKFNLWLDW